MFRFSIRELMLVTLVVGVCVAWRLDRSHLAGLANDAGRYKESLMKLRRMGMSVGPIMGQKMQAELDATWEAEHAGHSPKPAAMKR
jgi:hypothetical protein